MKEKCYILLVIRFICVHLYQNKSCLTEIHRTSQKLRLLPSHYSLFGKGS